MKVVLVASILALGACGKSGESKVAAHCRDVVTRTEDKLFASREKQIASWDEKRKRDAKEASEMVKDVLTTSCKVDGWSEKLLTCFESVTDEWDMFPCFESNLTHDQSSALAKALRDGFSRLSTATFHGLQK